MPRTRRKRRESPGPFTAAGLVRFYEEADVGVKMKPYLIVLLAFITSIIVIVAQKLVPPS